MKIISNNFDYYDSSAYLYGSDDRLRYDRNDFQLSKMWLYDQPCWSNDQVKIEVDFDLNLPSFNINGTVKVGRYYRSEGNAYHFFMVICGKLYPVFLMNTKTNRPVSTYDTIYHGFLPANSARHVNFKDCRWVIYDHASHDHFFWDVYDGSFVRHRIRLDLSDRFGVCNPNLIELSRKVGLPCFIVINQSSSNREKFGKYDTSVVKAIPLLSELGFEKIYPQYQLYQDIEYFIGNTLHTNPDTAPVGKPPQTNDEKIVAAGFDLKTSFRGKSRVSSRKRK